MKEGECEVERGTGLNSGKKDQSFSWLTMMQLYFLVTLSTLGRNQIIKVTRIEVKIRLHYENY